MTKQLQPADKVVSSLMALKAELEAQRETNTKAWEILLKINSCLYSTYPITGSSHVRLSND